MEGETDNSVTTRKQPKQQLSKSMQHMHFAVTADPIPRASSTAEPDSSHPATEQSESDAYGVPASIQPIRKPAHRSHSPKNNQKRTDPFAFGSRYLEEGDNIFEFNAWDHVETDDTYKAFSEEQYASQRASPVSDFDRKRFNDNPEKWWNLFYKNNKTNFFKNRKWLAQEFPILEEITKPGAGTAVVLEVGAGAGNSAFPILQRSQNPGLKVHACDFSKKAVDLIRENELYDGNNIQADVWDVASSPDSDNAGLPPGLTEESVDVVLMIFIFSALNPRQWNQAVKNIWRVLKPGGQVLFRDYGRGDLAQVRFKKGRYMEENFYVRGDGTRVYFFEQEELEEIWAGKRRKMEDDSGKEVQGDTEDERPIDQAETVVLPNPITETTKQLSDEQVEPLPPRLEDIELADQEYEGLADQAETTVLSTPQATPLATPPNELVEPSTNPATTAPHDLESADQEYEGLADQAQEIVLSTPQATPLATPPNELVNDTESPPPAFEVAHIGVDRRMLVNRQRRLKMYRCWMQAVFRKPGDVSGVATSTLRQDQESEVVPAENGRV